MTDKIAIRSARPGDLDAVFHLDEWRPEEAKISYWRGIFDRYAVSEAKDRFFLVAEMREEVVGFIVGEVRAWEFGSPPCGWVFALAVSPAAREYRIGTLMFDEMCARLKGAGVTTVRTMVERENRLTLSFFRSQGLRSGRYLQLEKELD